ncbi:MAG: hypothetical protein LBD81_03690 [Holosporaceae bacterium]|jgi:hypothetical protein|nr:hypothetical protein [Holosporaceae bacterium]
MKSLKICALFACCIFCCHATKEKLRPENAGFSLNSQENVSEALSAFTTKWPVKMKCILSLLESKYICTDKRIKDITFLKFFYKKIGHVINNDTERLEKLHSKDKLPNKELAKLFVSTIKITNRIDTINKITHRDKEYIYNFNQEVYKICELCEKASLL